VLRAVEASEARAEEPPATDAVVPPEAAPVAETAEPEVVAMIADEPALADVPEAAEARELCEAAEPARSAFDSFVEALVAVLLSGGATRAAAALPALLRSGRIEEALADVPLLRSAELRTTLEAWRAVLAGTSSDLSTCGASTLDRWAAELLAVVLGAPAARVEDLRRDLRRRGVAAFGMLDAA
jgi:hypothetical protein